MIHRILAAVWRLEITDDNLPLWIYHRNRFMLNYVLYRGSESQIITVLHFCNQMNLALNKQKVKALAHHSNPRIAALANGNMGAIKCRISA